ncbi:MAG: dTDP-4-dehydrorhamnose reductase [Xanthomonadales bacterium]|nr:dTDP-4-dehydrorhamnose reductase [Xanthomonadales bacterium]
MIAGRRILLLGHRGLVGHELVRCLSPYGRMVTSGRNSGDHPADLSDPASVDALLASSRPDIIVNAAAYTAVDLAEDHADEANRVNRDLPARLAEFAVENGALLVHFSTDYVFNGSNRRPYVETDPTDPIGVYGSSKLAGELAIHQSGCRHLIFRTSWVYANGGQSFVTKILARAATVKELKIVDDQYGTPTWSRTLAQLTTAAVERSEGIGSGVFHLSSTGQPVSWRGFAVEMLSLCRQRLPESPDVIPVATGEFPTRAQRPAYSALDNSLFQEKFGLRVPDWRQQLQWCLEDFRPFPHP